VTVSLAGKVVALVGMGSDADRVAAIGCAEAGADLALATLSTDQAAEFGMNSIANEAWVLGSEQFVRVMDATDPKLAASFVEETWARYGGCDALVVMAATPRVVVDAFVRRMGEAGGGVLVAVGESGLEVTPGEGVFVRPVDREEEVAAAIVASG
jgi:NAD(P)-dependent dehydrogenase (short-subunit alcohol dehydrogenase family)